MRKNPKDLGTFSRVAAFRLFAVSAILGIVAAGCAPAPEVGEPRPVPDFASFTLISQTILVPACSACHTAAGTYPALDETVTRDDLVGVASPVSGLVLVVEGDPDASALVQRLQTDMPPGAPLGVTDPAGLAAIRTWISNGAQND